MQPAFLGPSPLRLKDRVEAVEERRRDIVAKVSIQISLVVDAGTGHWSGAEPFTRAPRVDSGVEQQETETSSKYLEHRARLERWSKGDVSSVGFSWGNEGLLAALQTG